MITVAGAGPAGSAAAVAAIAAGHDVQLFDAARFPRHKVCGEFLSPEILAPLGRLGLLGHVQSAGAVSIHRLLLRFPTAEKSARLIEPALGLSRFALDALMLDEARRRGAHFTRASADLTARPLVLATGRQARAFRGNRLFGFKAHFEGPVTDTIELYFFDGAYVGVNCVEGGRTNVCGIAGESTLRRFDFDYDAFTAQFAPLRERLAPLSRVMDWLSVGPLLMTNRLSDPPIASVYPAGDALSFVDPFTGTGIASALITGELAGRCAAQQIPVSDYQLQCRRALRKPFAAASLFRAALNTRWAGAAASLIPAAWLVRWTRPRQAA